MKKILFTLFFSATCAIGFAQNMYSVNNSTSFSADFNDLQTAINTVAAGSILIVQGSGISYGDIIVDKPLVILGPGYHLSNQPLPYSQANKLPAEINYLTLRSTASGSIVSGMQATNTIRLDTCNNTLIESNKCLRGIYLNNSGNVTISSNYLAFTDGSVTLVSLYGSAGVIIKNNIFYSSGAINNFIQLWDNTGIVAISSAIAEYNTFLLNDSTSTNSESFKIYTLGAPSSLTLRNNIMANLAVNPVPQDFSSAVANGGILTLQNNVFTDGSYSSTAGAVNNASPSSLFADIGSSVYDLDYKLRNAAGSPAIGAGTGGSTCGAYGGAKPYSQSGLNLIPNIYELEVPVTGSTTQGVNITIKARANQ